jgi:hypothetical protein
MAAVLLNAANSIAKVVVRIVFAFIL